MPHDRIRHASLVSALVLISALLSAVPARAAQECRGRKVTIQGSAGANDITGTAGNDVIAGLGGDDTIEGGDGSDIVCGGDGNDTLSDRSGSGNILDGGPGEDTIVNEVIVDLGSTGGSGSSLGDTLFKIENATGTPGNDVLGGGPGPNVLSGGEGNDFFWYFPADTGDDTWDGGPGVDEANYGRAQGPVTANLQGTSATVEGAATGSDTVTGFENLTGSFFPDVLSGNDAPNEIQGYVETTWEADNLEGLGGDDKLLGAGGPVTLEGGDDNDHLLASGHPGQLLEGGAGNDTFGVPGGTDATGSPAQISYPGTSTYSGGDGNDEVWASEFNNQIFGGSGGDGLRGFGGDDVIDGGPDIDGGSGGYGTDTCVDVEVASSCATDTSADDRVGDSAPPGPEIDLSISSQLESKAADGDAIFRISVTNNGPIAAAAAFIWVYVAGSAENLDTSLCSFPNGNTTDVFCHFGQLPVGDTRSVRLRVDEAQGQALHVAALPSAIRDTTWSNNTTVFGSAGAPNVELIGFEVTQGIQNWKNHVTLIEGRPTWVRAFLRSSSDTLAPVRLELAGAGNGAGLGAVPPVFIPRRLVSTSLCSDIDTESIECERESPESSYIFKLPEAWVDEATDFLKLRVEGAEMTCGDHLPISQEHDTECWEAVTFSPSTNPGVFFIGIPWSGHHPGPAAFMEAERQVRSTFPVAGIGSVYESFSNPRPFAPTTSTGMAREVLSVGLSRYLDGCGSSCPAWYMGLLVDQPDGVSIDGLAMESLKAAVAYVKPRDPEHAIAHEMGHLAGRDHPGCTPDQEGGIDSNYPYEQGQLWPPKNGIDKDDENSIFFGFDPFTTRNFGRYQKEVGAGGLKSIYQPATCDLMGYSDSNWPSDYTYEGIRARLESLYPLPQPQSGRPVYQVSPQQDIILVSGIASGDDMGIESIHQLPAPADFEMPAPGDLEILFQSAAGQTIATYPFAPQGEDGAFMLALPADPSVARVSLLSNGTEIDAETASPAAPAVTITSPVAGVTLDAAALFEWTATDADGDPLTYAVQYSADDGTTWKTLDVWLDAPSLTVDTDFLAGSTTAKFRVLASDGFHTTIATLAGNFSVVAGRPDVSLSLPSPNSVHVRGEALVLAASAYDKEDGSLDDPAFSWTSERDGQLGVGASLVIDASDLSLGHHVLTVSAADSDGAVTTAGAPITVYAATADIPRCGRLVATMVGTEGDDVLRGTSAADVIVGLGGNDKISGLEANDLVCGGSGKDRLFGGPGADVLLGGGGNDVLDGGSGKDKCTGNPGQDRFKGCETKKQ